MRYLDIENPKIRMPKRISVNTDDVARMIYDYEDDSLDFIDASDEE
jgi:hypothetical protein